MLRKFQTSKSFNKLPLINYSDTDYEDFINLYKKCTAKPYSFLVIDTTLASDNPLRFRKNLSEIIQKIIMTIDDKITDEKLQYYISIIIRQKYRYGYLTDD